ncbi:uncharacterized protein [Lepeophtheirus salmonis]|uniref:Uncharacterized protein n=1 Tax=Lepeophtheirus salmonis TaxID=72036 RepID=A0A0K2U8F9_LEPSM|nr:uncharacterized protein LOC121116823 [Lepeophtheirus salmonis]
MILYKIGTIFLIINILSMAIASPASRKLKKRKLSPRKIEVEEIDAFEPSFLSPISSDTQDRSFDIGVQKQTLTEEIKSDKDGGGISTGLLGIKSDMAEAFGNFLYDKYIKKYYKVLKEAMIFNKEGADERGAREEGSLGKLILDVARVMVSDVIGITLGNYMGFQTERTDNEGSFFDIFVNAVKKQSMSKKMGCPV